MPQQQFKGYSQDQMKRIASKLGHTGDLNTFNNYLDSNPKAMGKYKALKDAAVKRYARGGMVKSSAYAEGGAVQAAYEKNLGRQANPEALAWYENQVATGQKTIEQVSADLAYSDEGKNYTVAKTNEAVQAAFKENLGRGAGQSGQDYYAGKYTELIEQGIEPELAKQVIGGELKRSTEGGQYAETKQQRYVSEDQQVPQMYQTLGIDINNPNRAYSQENVDYNTTDQTIDALGRTGDNTAADTAAIQQVYQNQLGRAAGTKGADYYADLMAGGTNLDTVRGQVAGSPEAGTYNTTGQQQYVAPANRIDGVKYNETGTGNVGTPPPVDGTPPPVDGTPPPADGAKVPTMLEKDAIARRYRPELVEGAKTVGSATTTNTNQLMDTTKGQVDLTTAGLPTAVAGSATAGSAAAITTPTVKNTASTTDADATNKAMLALTKAQTGTIDSDNKVKAQEQTISAVSDLVAAQTTATQVNGAPTRTLQGGELVDPAADAQKAAAFTEQITAAQGDPSSRATVQGQLATLMTSFDEGNTPAWAAGAMRNVTAQMAARGIGSSSMAGQALIQAALESALPIATADAQTYAQFDLTNLTNRQQRSMLAAQQRAEFMGIEFDQAFQSRVNNSNKISAVANMQFNADQQIAIENAQLAGTVNIANLSHRQANVMAEAAALSQLDISNLNNRQQAQVQNAKTFLDMDLANVTNQQQTSLFKAQQRSISILSDAAADNAASQFNATSKNQTEQFFANLSSTVSQFNAAQESAISQSNAGDKTAVSKFNMEVKNQRDQFNATNVLAINQSNAVWRRQIATADTTAINRANEINAKSLLDISNTSYDNLWQEHRDEMDWVYKTADNERDRIAKLAITVLEGEQAIAAAGIAADAAASSSLGNAVVSLFTTKLGGTVLEGIL